MVVFPAWSFGTASEVSVAVPDGYEVRVDGDALTEADGRLVSGPIENPAAWLALVTATRPAEYTTFDATVPLDGGTADLQVRAFADDEAVGGAHAGADRACACRCSRRRSGCRIRASASSS